MANKWQSAAAVVEDAVVVIPAGQKESTEIDLIGTTIMGLYIPAGFQGARVFFKAAHSEGDPFVPVIVMNQGELTAAATPNTYIVFNYHNAAGIRRLKIEADTVQTAERIIKIAARPL